MGLNVLTLTLPIFRGGKQLITPMLAGLMENDNSIMWSFDRFFTEVNRISNKVCVHVMSLYTGKKINVYVDKQQW